MSEKINEAFESWKENSQPSELEHHKISHSRRKTKRWMDESEKYFKMFGYEKNDFDGKKIIDLGCGSRLRTLWFTNPYIIAIEPLAEEFKSINFCDLDQADELYSKPAEEFLENLENGVDAILCLNVLDHCYDAKSILENCYKYLKDDGEMLLAVDLHDGRDEKHPIQLNDGILKELVEGVGFKTKREYPPKRALFSGKCKGVAMVLVKELEKENNEK